MREKECYSPDQESAITNWKAVCSQISYDKSSTEFQSRAKSSLENNLLLLIHLSMTADMKSIK